MLYYPCLYKQGHSFMQHVEALEHVQLDRPSVVTVGVFDGVHVGHQQLIHQLVTEAHQTQRAAVVLTFFPHPDVILRGTAGRYYLTTPEEKAALLGELGVDGVVTHPFDEHIRQIRAADFVDQLLDHLKMSALWATADFALGYKREGNLQFLAAQGQEKNFTVETIELVHRDGNGAKISSSDIRAVLAESGEVQQAATWLGRNYSVHGKVVQGNQRGRTIGFPTANLDVWEQKVVPAFGVYACRARIGHERFNAVTNVGNRPTFEGKNMTIEAHLLDFDRDIYGQDVQLEFVQRLRGEQKFDGIEALVAQIGKDRDTAREILQKK